jgi:hypothetical protein
MRALNRLFTGISQSSPPVAELQCLCYWQTWRPFKPGRSVRTDGVGKLLPTPSPRRCLSILRSVQSRADW